MACIVKSSSVFYTVTFNGNGGSSPASIKVMSGQSVGSLPSTSKTGYTSLGWFTESVGGQQVNSETKITSDITFYAHWQANTYTVSFNANGHGTNPSSITVTYDSAYGTLPSLTDTNYNFQGWYLGSTQITASSIVKITSNTTLTASWVGKPITITLNPTLYGRYADSTKGVAKTFTTPYGSQLSSVVNNANSPYVMYDGSSNQALYDITKQHVLLWGIKNPYTDANAFDEQYIVKPTDIVTAPLTLYPGYEVKVSLTFSNVQVMFEKIVVAKRDELTSYYFNTSYMTGVTYLNPGTSTIKMSNSFYFDCYINTAYYSKVNWYYRNYNNTLVSIGYGQGVRFSTRYPIYLINDPTGNANLQLDFETTGIKAIFNFYSSATTGWIRDPDYCWPQLIP